MNNTAIYNTLNSDNSNIANIKAQHQQIMTTIKNRFLKFEPMIKIPILSENTFFTVITFSNSNSFT